MKLTRALVELIVDRMLSLWSSSERWTKDMLARDRRGLLVDPLDRDAISWCLVGAFQRAIHELNLAQIQNAGMRFMDECAKTEFGAPMTTFNDRSGTSFEDVQLFVKRLKEKDIPAYAGNCQCADCTLTSDF